MRHRIIITALAVLAAGAAAQAAAQPAPWTQDRNVDTPYCDLAPVPQVGVQETARENLSERTLEITLDSQAMQGAQRIVITLPRDHDASGKTRYPVLWLLHGALDNQRSYFDNGIEDLLGDLPLIAVAVNSGPNNGYLDWYGSLSGSGDIAPAWRTHHIEEVLPFVEANFPVRTDRDGRAIAGISMGGGGTMHYAALYPQLFGTAASLSGAVNVTREYPYFPALQLGLNLTSLATGGPNPYCSYGDFVLNHITWKAADATYLAENLRNTAIWVSCGSGPPHLVPYVNLAPDPVELEACEQTEVFMLELDRYGIPHTDNFYIGTHTWDQWTRELGKLLPWIMQRFEAKSAAPGKFDYRNAHARFSAWGWDFAAYRDVREFVYLQGVSREGLSVSGSGALDVLTPPLYAAGAPVELDDGSGPQLLEADDEGRLAFRLALGPSHARQQMNFTEAHTAQWMRRDVSLRELSSAQPAKAASTARFGGAFGAWIFLMLAGLVNALNRCRHACVPIVI